jgi:predicted TPR repeat methyltransferase
VTSPDPYARLAGVYDELVVDPCHSDWADFLQRMWAEADVRRVLDVCCGSGLMTVQLRDRGFRVTGVDASPAMLARARELLGADADLRLAVLPDLPVDETYDAAVSTLDGLNYLSLPDFRLTLRAIAEHLRPGGWLVFDIHTAAVLRLLTENPLIAGEQDGSTYALSSIVDVSTGRCATTIMLTAADPERSFVEEHVQYVHRDEDVQMALEDGGFAVIAVTDEYTDEPTGPDSLRATWVARKNADA